MAMVNDPNNRASTNVCLPGVVMKSALFQGKLSVCCFNTQSICARKLSKLDELRQILMIAKVDIVCVTESWLNEKTDTNILSINGYHIIRHDRLGRLGGGILIYIKHGIKFDIVAKSDNQLGIPHTEYMAFEASIQNYKILIACFYNPPDVDSAECVDDIQLNFGSKYEYSLFLGDFNTNLLEPSRKTTRLSSVLSTFNMSCLGNQPTFYHMNGSSQLDLMFFSDESKVLRFNQVDAPVFSKHDLIFASFDFDVDHNISPYSFRDYNSINVDGLLEHFNNLDWLNFIEIVILISYLSFLTMK